MDRTVEVEREREREPDTREGEDEPSAGRLAGLRPSVPRPGLPLSFRALAVALALGVAAMVGGTFAPVPGARFGLLFAGTFLYGVTSAASRYVECALAGLLAAGLGFVLSVVLGGALLPVLTGYGVELAGVGVTTGGLVALVGHYFGRDLRAGWTS
ncbi:MAG: hypothetical protein A07HB70_02249 [uncultured archaeon A07HB70]|nr:MAG: hypothetical protein A07HB70_02249 [uncultured archaeon A07HB70]